VKGQSSPQEVACGVFVCVRAMRASLAIEFRLGDTVLRCCVSTVLAAIGGVPGSTSIHVRPASSALERSIETNRPQPASPMLRDSPDLARAPLAKYWPGLLGSGTGLARRSMLVICRSSTTSSS
jgi:copper chaperone CopZ